MIRNSKILKYILCTLIAMLSAIILYVVLAQDKNQIFDFHLFNKTNTDTSTKYFISDTPLTYTLFIPVNNSEQSFEDNPVWTELQKVTNIHFEFISPVGNESADEALMRLYITGNYPDAVFNTTSGYSGGYSKAIYDGMYIDINPYLDECAPNYKKLISENSDILSDVYTEYGQLPGFWEIYELETSLPIIGGLAIRKDYLEQTGLEVPTTINEWTTLLRELKKIDEIQYPLLFAQENGVNVTGEFLSAYGIDAPPISTMNPIEQLFYVENGEIKYGAIEDGYKNYLLLMNQWYTEGLLDKNFAFRDFENIDERNDLIIKGEVAATWQYSEWSSLLIDANGQKIEMVGAPMPKLKESDKNVGWMVSRKPYLGKLLSITSSCENVEPLVQFFDFLYSEEGALYLNFGLEGDTYEMVDGLPVYTSKIIDYEEGSLNGVAKYINNNSVLLYNLSYTEYVQKQLFGEDSLEMKQIWIDSSDTFSLDVSLTVDESRRLNKIMSNITSYVTEHTIKSIVSTNEAMNWESDIAVIESMGVDRAITIMQNAYDRKKVNQNETN